jgi:tetratricopeptide (TPR) repeat protein
MSARIPREEELFDEARQLPDSTQRSAFLDRTCSGNPALRARLTGLLEAEFAAGRFFAEGGAALKLSTLQLRATGVTMPVTADPGEETAGTRIGRYKLLEKIGEGGWGVVYRAEQQEPVRRQVALKIIKLGMETTSVVARFEAERQALALMDHPNIARVYDAGATERGLPYFVMELVQGVKITDYCDEHRLGLRARLDLFVLVCHALQHAHQKGIIHGDIKPSNVMVSTQDGAAMPKVIDFGIAKATEARLADRLPFTAYAQLIGTPAYMSPEQADMSNLDADTRSDIYSLGVLLYELLVGTTPFASDELLEAGLDGMRRVLRETAPPRPSARLASLPAVDLARLAASRQCEPRRLIPLVRGDLDWIAMKALEKERSRRYETANGLAMDLLRHLHHEPVVACPPGRLYKFRKLVRRNRGVFLAAGAVAAALVAGFGTSTWLFLREREARQRAVAAEQQQARLRHEAEAREKISQTSLLVSQERFEEADKLVQELPLGQPTVEGAAVLRSIAEWHALRLQWRQAAERAALLLQVNLLDGSDAASLDCLRAAPAFIERGDMNGYERFRQDAIARFTAAPCPFSDRIVKVSLLLPANDRLVESLRPLGDATARYFRQADQGGDVFTAAWRAVSLGLLEYRRGNYESAIEWCRRCLAYPGANAPRAATARAIIALAAQRLGRLEEARTELAAAREIVDSKFRTRLDPGNPVQGFWFDWLFVRILLREAVAQLESAPRLS